MSLRDRTIAVERTPSAASKSGHLPIGRVVSGSLAVGLIAGGILPFLPVRSVNEPFSLAMVLLGFALGWGLLALISARATDQPQSWAWVPTSFMALSASLVLMPSPAVRDALAWIWPPALMSLAVWVWARARRDLHSRTRVLLLNPVLVVLMLCALGGAYEVIGHATEPAVAMRGQLIDVGPYRLHLECTGTGRPTVILEPGGGGSAATMGWIAPAVSRESKVCVYDRAGRGWSDPAAIAPDGAQIASDLHTLLARAEVPGPFVLVGHSFGGLYVRTYAAKYPEQVAGLVLVDSTASTNSAVNRPRADDYSVLKHVSTLVATTSRLGIGRLIADAGFSGLPPRYRDEARASASTGMEMGSFLDEFGVANRSESEAGALLGLGATPLVVLTAERGNAKGWMATQDKLVMLSSNSLHRVVPGASHKSLIENQHDAAAVTRAVRDVLVSIRTETPLDHLQTGQLHGHLRLHHQDRHLKN